MNVASRYLFMYRVYFLLVGLSLLFVGCEPSPSPEELSKNLVVQTTFDETINFKSYSTYAMPLDTLGLVSNSVNDTLFLGEYSKMVTQRLKSNMDSRGYSWVEKNQTPDLGLTAFIVNNFNVFQTINYPNYYGGYYSPYYGYYFPVVNTYASNAGILIVQLVDLKQKTAQNQFRVIWTCYIGDIIASPDPIKQSVDAVDQAFAQTSAIGK